MVFLVDVHTGVLAGVIHHINYKLPTNAVTFMHFFSVAQVSILSVASV